LILFQLNSAICLILLALLPQSVNPKERKGMIQVKFTLEVPYFQSM